jgi:hypothetical protein
MKTLLTFLFFLPAICFSQNKKGISEQILSAIKMSDLIVSPSDYMLDQNASEIDYIEFQRENEFSKAKKVYAVITTRDGFDQDYSIGQYFQYLRSENQVGFFITVHLKDGNVVTSHMAIDFSNGSIPESGDYEAADYDAEGEPFYGEWDGIKVVAL